MQELKGFSVFCRRRDESPKLDHYSPCTPHPIIAASADQQRVRWYMEVVNLRKKSIGWMHPPVSRVGKVKVVRVVRQFHAHLGGVHPVPRDPHGIPRRLSRPPVAVQLLYLKRSLVDGEERAQLFLPQKQRLGPGHLLHQFGQLRLRLRSR